ncbi:MAG: hypothetical protein E7610_06000 [Ruminococcaceae bacterium]|nr:hypothetical protein [Oscillospiraceae bacterium]
MTQESLMDAITAMDEELLGEALDTRSRLLPRADRRIKPLAVKRIGLAACLALALLVVPYAKLVFSGSHASGHISEQYFSVASVEQALGRDILLEPLEEALRLTSDSTLQINPAPNITVSSTHKGGPPSMLKARYNAVEADNSLDTDDPQTKVELYILFDHDDLNDSYVGGYEEQGLSKQYGDITVVYSLIQDPLMHGQAKFLYGGDLYVLDVQSTGDRHFLMKYLDILLGEEALS